jgi:hypothetical protein
MNNRNPAQRSMVPLAPTPTPAQTPTYLNVFTVEEFESNGKTGKRWTRSAPPSRIKRESASASS